MKKLVFSCAIMLLAATQSFAGSTAIARYGRNTMFIENQPVFSPDGSRIAIQARDGRNLRGYIAHIWVGSSRSGRFKRIYSKAVNHITWIDNNEIAFHDRSVRSAVVVKAVQVNSGTVRTLYTRRLRRSGYSTETVNLLKISNTGRYLLMKDRSGFFLQDLSANRRISISGFNYMFHRHNTAVAFNHDDTSLLVKDDAAESRNAYMLYRVTGSGLQRQGTLNFSSILGRGKSLTKYFHFSRSGNTIGFAVEYCRGGCRLLTYTYDIQSRRTRPTGTIRGNQVLSVNWNHNLSKVVFNDFHRTLVVKDVR